MCHRMEEGRRVKRPGVSVVLHTAYPDYVVRFRNHESSATALIGVTVRGTVDSNGGGICCERFCRVAPWGSTVAPHTAGTG